MSRGLLFSGYSVYAYMLRRSYTTFTLVVDGAVSVEISLTNHLIDLLICQLLSQIRHHVTQLCRADVTVYAITIDQLINQGLKFLKTCASGCHPSLEKNLYL